MNKLSVTSKLAPNNLMTFMYSFHFSKVESHFGFPIPLNALIESQLEMACSDGKTSTKSDYRSVLSTSIIVTLLPVPSCTNNFTTNLLE